MYPFFTDIGKAKVSQVLEALEFVSADYNLDLAVLPSCPPLEGVGGGKTNYKFISLNGAFKTATRILRNSQRQN